MHVRTCAGPALALVLAAAGAPALAQQTSPETAPAAGVASPRTTVVPDQLAPVSVVEKTSFSLSFIREVMAGSFALACSVGQ